MRIAVFGGKGQVATELAALDGVALYDRKVADFLNPAQVAACAERLEADAIVNAAAYTAVDRAESEPEAARIINAGSVAALAEVAARRGLPLVHLSTDYVFNGSGTTPWAPQTPTDPLGVYGLTKRDGEIAVAAAGGPHAILRTSWVFSAHGGNFVKTMLRLGAERDRLGVVDDQIGGPTPAGAIAAAATEIARALVADPEKSGIYHFSGAPDVSWADFAQAIFDEAGLDVQIDRIATRDYPTPARRPANSRLDCSSTWETFGIERPDWLEALREVLQDLRAA